MARMTPKQLTFCKEYVKNGGNITQAALTAGYSKKTAHATGSENMNKPAIKAYIAELQEKIDEKTGHTIASLAEIQEFRSKVLRGEEKDQFELDPALADRLKAANDLEKALRIKEEQEEERRIAEQARMAGVYHMDLYDIADVFHPVIRSIRDYKYTEYVFPGGRGSTKSSEIAMNVIELIKNNHDMHALVLRKIGNTIRDSVYAQIKWAIAKQDLEEEFDFKTSPLEIIYKPTKQRIYFRGSDDPLKIKSIKPEFGYIGIVWFEELDQFEGEEEIRSVEQSALRGGNVAFKFKSFNPPKSRNNWANEYVEKAALRPEAVVVHSSYLDVPRDWLGSIFLEDAERLKQANPRAYEHEYLGKPNGTGGQVFEYIEERDITDEEIARFDTIYQGEDWGFFPDPFAFIRAYYNPREEKIYLIDEIYENRLSNATTAELIKKKGYDDYEIIADSSEPKSIKDHLDCGILVRGAIKGPGSVEHGMKWLQVRTIVIDKRRTPNAFREITRYEFDRDKEGNVISGYPDKDNHIIDALRYAFEPVSRGRGSSA